MNRTLRIVFLLLTFLTATASHAGFKSKTFVSGESIKTIGLLKIGDPRGYFLGEGGGPGAAGQVFGLAGLLFEQFKKPKHPEYASAGFHFGAETERVLIEHLKAAGFNVITVPVNRKKSYQLLDDYDALSVPNVDAYLDIVPGGVGYRKSTFSAFPGAAHKVGPVVSVFVQLVSARTKEILYAESLEYGWRKATLGNAGIDIVAPDNYMFEDTDALERDLLSGSGNSRGLAQLTQGIDVAMRRIVSEFSAYPATGRSIAEARPAQTPLDERERYTPTVEAVPADRPLPRASPDLRDRYKPIVAEAEDTVSTGSSAGDAVRVLFAGNTSIGTTTSSKSGWMYTRSDYTILGHLSNGDMDEGTWRISQEGWFCRTWKTWADGKEGCWQVKEKIGYVKLTPKAGTADRYVIEILRGHTGLQYRREH